MIVWRLNVAYETARSRSLFIILPGEGVWRGEESRGGLFQLKVKKLKERTFCD